MATHINASSVAALHLEVDTYKGNCSRSARTLNQVMLPDSQSRYGMIENSYSTSRFARGSVAWPASAAHCSEVLCVLRSRVHLDLHDHHDLYTALLF